MRLLLALLVGLLATPAAAQLHPTARAVITDAIDKAIRPGFASFAAYAHEMNERVEELCDAPSDDRLAVVHETFADVVTSWARIEFYRFGPLMVDNRSERILFWPDRKGIGLKQVQQILATKDETATTTARLRQKSVAVQGLAALEFVLFGTGSGELATIAGAFRCDYAAAISRGMAQTAAQLNAEWQNPDGIAARMIRPGENDADYRDNAEVLEELVGVVAHGVEAIRDQRILPFLGRDGAKSNPKLALFWRSNLTVPSLEANFAGLEAILTQSAIWEYAPAEQSIVGGDAEAAFSAVAAAAARVTGTVEEAVADPARKQALADIVATSQVLGKLTGEDLPAALGLSVGFSSLDGD